MLGIVLLSVTLAAAQGERAPEPKDEPGSRLVGDGMIVPGQRVGPLRLSMTIEQMTPLLPRTVKREVLLQGRIFTIGIFILGREPPLTKAPR